MVLAKLRKRRSDHVQANWQRGGNTQRARGVATGGLCRLFDILGVLEKPKRALMQVASFSRQRK